MSSAAALWSRRQCSCRNFSRYKVVFSCQKVLTCSNNSIPRSFWKSLSMVEHEGLKAINNFDRLSSCFTIFCLSKLQIDQYMIIILQANSNLHGAPGCSPTLPCSPLNPLPPVNRSLSFAYSFSLVFILAFSPLISTQSNQTSSHKWLL